MNALDVARWQFGITTVYHFIFVPLTLGLSMLVAGRPPPVGCRINPATHRAELTSIWKVLTNSTTLVTFPHVLFGGFLTGGVFLVGIAAWHLARRNDAELFRRALRYGLAVSLIAAV